MKVGMVTGGEWEMGPSQLERAGPLRRRRGQPRTCQRMGESDQDLVPVPAGLRSTDDSFVTGGKAKILGTEAHGARRPGA